MTPRWVSSGGGIKLDSLLVILIQISVVVLVVVVVIVVVVVFFVFFFFWGGGGGGVLIFQFDTYMIIHSQASRKESVIQNKFPINICSGYSKNCLNETVLLSTQNICLNLY